MRDIVRHMISAFSLLPLMATAVIVTSCSDFIWERGYDCGESDTDTGQTVNLEIEVKTPSDVSKAPTRSFFKTDTDRQNRITDVAVMLFTLDANNNPERMVEVMTPYSFTRDEHDKTLYHASFATPLSAKIRNKKLRVGVLANASGLLDALQNAGDTGLSFQEVRDLLHTVISDDSGDLDGNLTPRTPADIDAPFVMWGLPPDILTLRGDTHVALEACLMRDLAGFNIWLCDELKANGLFDFRTVHFYKPSSTVSHVPDVTKIAATTDATGHPYYYATSPSLWKDNKVFYRWDYTDCVENGEFRDICFVPEGDVVMKGVNNGAGKVFDINHINRPAVIVGGYYNGSPVMSYYRIDICNEEGNLVDILRNHMYDIEIRSVLGPGQPTPDEAYDNNNIMIVAQITDWCLVDRNVMYNGADWITVSKRLINLTGEAGAGTTFVINSSVPLEEWEFSLGEDGEFTTASLLESEHFFVTRPVEQKGSKMLVVTKKRLPPESEPVIERLYVRIGGRVLFYITIVQHPLQENYWFDGGYFPGTEGPWEGVIHFPIGGEDPHIPPGSFVEFLKWLFGGDYNGTVGDGDNVSDSEYINSFFWKFITWFFTDEYGHVIGGTPEDWDEAWDNPMAVIVYNLLRWMLGGHFYDEIYGPDYDPDDPDNPPSSLGFEIFKRFMTWLKGEDIFGNLTDPDDPYNPDDPHETKLGFQIFLKFMQWLKGDDFMKNLEGFGDDETGDDKEDSHPIDILFDVIKWFVDSFSGDVGNDPDGEGGGDDQSSGSGSLDFGTGDRGWNSDNSHIFETELPVVEDETGN